MCRSAAVLGIFSLQAQALKIELNYDHDSHGFFTRPGSREAMRAVADFFESIIDDRLMGIDPAQHGGTWTAWTFKPADPFGSNPYLQIPNLVVPEDTIIIFVGGANISSAGVGGSGGIASLSGPVDWRNRVRFRGKAGAAASPPSEFGTWGGMVSFGLDKSWSFALDRNEAGKVSFVSVAVHELAHVLGIGSAPSWTALQSSGFFLGENAMNAFGGPVPVTSNGAHWRDDGVCVSGGAHNPDNSLNVLSKTYASFGTSHGVDQIALMDPSACLGGQKVKVFTDLDLAALVDIGWKVRPSPKLTIDAPQAGSTEVRLRWVTSSFHDYRIERLNTTGSWASVVEISGDGAACDVAVPTGGAPSGIYRVGVTPKSATPSMMLAAIDPVVMEAAVEVDVDESAAAAMPRMISGCFCHAPGDQ